MRVRAYVIETDAGSAPNYDAPCTTLAVCKPRIRKTATVGDLVLAFAGQKVNRFEPHTVVWAGLVSEKLTFAEYWNDQRFDSKKPDRCAHPDNFYRPRDGGLEWVLNPVHGTDQFNRDTGGVYVLTFIRSWRFGAHGPLMPEQFGIRIAMNARRAGRVVHMQDDEWHRLEAWLDSQTQAKKGPSSPVRPCKPPRNAIQRPLPATRRSRC